MEPDYAGPLSCSKGDERPLKDLKLKSGLLRIVLLEEHCRGRVKDVLEKETEIRGDSEDYGCD